MAILAGKTARDVMQTGLVTLSEESTLADAVQTFEDYKITGAPVLDSFGRLVGVISAADIANTTHMDDGRLRTERGEYYLAHRADEGEDSDSFEGMSSYNFSNDDSDRVREWMSPRVISVDPACALDDVCKRMTDDKVHRVLVTEGDALLGIITSMDIVRAVANRA